jgi:hypothetical protein
MAYGMQLQAALNRLDQALLALNRMIKNGQVREAVEYMETGPLKERYDELQNIITIAGGPGELGGMGTTQTGTL